MSTRPNSISAPLYGFAIKRPWFVLVLAILGIGAAGSFLPQLVVDTRPNAFLSPDNPALVYREKVKEQFGLSDPLIVALHRDGPDGIYTVEALAALANLADAVATLEFVDSDHLMSLATQDNIRSDSYGMDIGPFLEPLPESAEEALAIREQVNQFPLVEGSLVSVNGSTALIVAELLDEEAAEATYQQLEVLVSGFDLPAGVSVHVAGEAAVAGYLSAYIDADAQRLNPLAWLIIMIIMGVAFRRVSPLIVTNVIIIASTVGSLGIMAAAGIPFYMITTALPVILIGISVADAIHIYSHYFDLQNIEPDLPHDELVRRTMSDMFNPVTQTTLTTMAGFLGLYFAAYMPPFKFFGLFAAIGVFIAWLYSMTVVPAAICLTRPRRIVQVESDTDPDSFRRFMRALGTATFNFPRTMVFAATAITVSGLLAASQILVDEDPMVIFDEAEPIRIADTLINREMDGANVLDVVIETPEFEGLFDPDALRSMEALQVYAEALPAVGGSVSIVDYLKQMNRALNEGREDAYVLPESRDAIAQYFLLYSAMGDPTDFEEEIDYDYRMANIRINLKSSSYQDFKIVVEAMQEYIDQNFTSPGLTATLSGRANLNYHWIKDLGDSHFAGLIVALLSVWAVAGLLFRSMLAGVFALLPVAVSILLIYATMVLFDIRLGVGTSMFAAVAIGLGVDFSIHTLQRYRVYYQQVKGDPGQIVILFYSSTGKALLINFLAIGCGFGILMVSKVASLNNFGGILLVSVGSSFLASMTLLPALLRILNPRFITRDPDPLSARLEP